MDGYNARANTYSTTLSSSARFVLLRPVSFYLPPTPTGLNRHDVSRMLERERERERGYDPRVVATSRLE